MSELRREIDYFLKNGMIKTLEKYDKELPHIEFFKKMVKTDIDHIEIVVEKMNSLLEGKFDEVVENKDRSPKEYCELINIISSLEDDEKNFLLFTALYHDIGKSIIRPRHGPEGADIIKDSGYVERKRFYRLGFIRSKFFLMADLIRFHDYLAMVGTGETSHLIFAEVLSPISNISLSNKNYVDKFIDYLLILNLADVAGSIEEKISCEHFRTLLYDFKVIKNAHENISKIVYKNVFKEDSNSSIIDIHKKTIVFRDPHAILSELQKVAIKLTNERIRRLVRTGFNSVKKKEGRRYSKWMEYHYKEGLERNQLKPFEKWFGRDYEKRVVDIEPIVASLRGINVKPDFYYKFPLICKL
ncbi:MAG: hypothetical protein PQ964_02475 [Methanobacteriaceae archaeon]